MAQDDLARVLLDAIEEREAKLLVWGDTEGFFTFDELEELADQLIAHTDYKDIFGDDLVEDLISRAMIFEVGRECYKSRMAQTVHLHRNSRQWFHGKKIAESSTLVSDFRFLRSPRRYPERNVSAADLLEDWPGHRLEELTKKALGILMGDFQLSGFQKRACVDILQRIPSKQRIYATSTIICAGTGSGKTNAFYWPCLAYISAAVCNSSERRVRTLAIYPRTELLKDQFFEAWSQCRSLDFLTQAGAGRKIRIGALFGDTIKTLKDARASNDAYHSYSALRCITNNCRGELRWNRADFNSGVEKLICHMCGSEVPGDEVALTRESIIMNPPDILFTTTEMLNQKMTDPSYRALFGVGSGKSIPLVLLDEVHTYVGSAGANIAFLLRRFTHLTQKAIHFVGLSATLAEAETFFSRLTSTKLEDTNLIEPLGEELIEEGSEYLLVLRGDAVSQTALLSTTIQAAMLAARAQDPLENAKSCGIWGSKTFIFTDDLDATNRLYSQLADAEGQVAHYGNLRPKDTGSLAMLRNSRISDESPATLTRYGQDWSMAKTIGYELDINDRVRIARTSSQDVGVDATAQIIVATATLEVGYNDPDVGTVIQHKAPRDFAAYLQRKGRAGRGRLMRPWMIITLSEFGKDRTAFQYYERLLDPEIKALVLPLENDHILRMQAAMATLDWIFTKTKTFNVWRDLNFPHLYLSSRLRGEILALLSGLIDDDSLRDDLEIYISDALVVDSTVVDELMWKPPRSIYNEVLPTLMRKIETKWGRWDSSEAEIVPWTEVNEQWGSPLAEFIPPQLFSGLNTPDLLIGLERGEDRSLEHMPFFSGLKEFAPGRISKRYSIARGDYSDWVFPNNLTPSNALHNTKIGLEIFDVFSANISFIETSYCHELDLTLDVYRPIQIQTQSLSRQFVMTDKSNAQLRWYSLYRTHELPVAHNVPAESQWHCDRFVSIAFYTHQTMTPVEILRYTTGSDAELTFRDGSRAALAINWQNDEKPVGIGTTVMVDAVRFDFVCDAGAIQHKILDADLVRALRFGYLQKMLEESDLFDGNKFKANWVCECFLTAVALEAFNTQVSALDAVGSVCGNTSKYSLEDTRKMLFRVDFELLVQENGDYSESQKEQKLQLELREILTSPKTCATLKDLGSILFADLRNNPNFINWCRYLMANTLAAGAKQTICTLLPHVSDQDLAAETKVESEVITIWLSEKEAGGGGIVTAFEDKYFEDTLGTLKTFAATLRPGDYEQLDTDLTALLCKSVSIDSVSSSLDRVRSANNYSERLSANQQLKHTLIESGFEFSHSFASVLFSRVLRPGSNIDSDTLLYEYLTFWASLEKQLDLELPINIAAVVIVRSNQTDDDIYQKACEIQSVLWPRGSSVRQENLPFYNQFQSHNNRTERLLAIKLCQEEVREIFFKSQKWLESLYEAISLQGSAELIVDRDYANQISCIVTKINVTPLDTAYGLLLYPRIISIRRELNSIRMTVELSEVSH